MRKLEYISAVGLAALMLTAVATGPGLVGKAWGQSFGMIAATVVKTDDARGLIIRSKPSDSSEPLGYLPAGTELRGCNDFRDGWMRLQTPSSGGWVNMANLKPVGGEAKVIAVDKPDLCLPVRKGPGEWYEKTGCAEMGQKLQLSGIWSVNNFAQLENGGWINASEIVTDLVSCEAPAATAATESQPLDDQDAWAEPPIPTNYAGVGSGFGYAPWDYEFADPYLYGEYGGYGYFPTGNSFGTYVILNRHHRYFHRVLPVRNFRLAVNTPNTLVRVGTDPRRVFVNTAGLTRWNNRMIVPQRSVSTFVPRSTFSFPVRSFRSSGSGFRVTGFSSGGGFRMAGGRRR